MRDDEGAPEERTADPAAGSREPERIGPYRVQARLGAGGMGEVLLAYDERLGRSVAIKRLHPGGGPGADERRRRLRREARAAAGLSHPAIVQVHDVVFEPDSDAVVMEFVPGRTLAREAAAGVDGARALRLARQVAEGLAAAHARGFVHRDLKAENVMVTPEGTAKILDFGLAKELAAGAGDDSLTAAGTVLGTTRAMSPEQAAGRTIDSRSDLFSLGVLLYELFTGCSPFRADSPLASLQRILTERPPPARRLRPELPEELSRLIDSLLEKDPAARPAGAGEVAARLAASEMTAGVAGLGPPRRPAAGDGLSEAVTAPPPSPRAARPGERGTPAAARGRRAVPRAALIAGAAAAGVTALWALVGPWRGGEPLRVVVMPVPAPAAGAANPDAVAFGVEEAMLGGLASLEGLEALEPAQAAGAAAPAAAARAAAADQVVRATLDCGGGECRVSLHRLAAGEGVVLGVSEPFFVPTAPEDAHDLAAAVGGRLAELFADHRPRRPLARPPVRDRDYAAVLDLKRRNDRGEEALGAAELAELERLLATSPGLLEGQLLAAGVARTLGRLDEALGFAEAARRTAPGDPRPLAERFRVELARGDPAAADETLERLGELAPGQTRTLAMRAELLAARGRLDDAVALARRVVERRPSWRNVYLLVDLELASGELEPARGRLEAALREMPENPWLLAKLAELETRDGGLSAAADLYRRLIAVRPRRQYLTSLGWVHYLRGEFEDAAAGYRRALELDPGDPLARFNLAAALEASGRGEEAREICRGLLAEGEPGAADGGATVHDALRAQCLARLGESRAAHRLIGEVLAGQPDRPDALYQAAQVYALLGERLAALDAVERARRQGMRPHWFAVPEFDGLRGDPAFRELTAGRSR